MRWVFLFFSTDWIDWGNLRAVELDRNDSNTRSKLAINHLDQTSLLSNFGLNRFDSSFERIRFAFAFAPRKQDLSRRRIFKNFPPRLYRVLVRFFSLSKLNHSFFFFFIFVCYNDDDNSSIAGCYQCRKDLYFIFLCSDAFTNIL